MLRYTLPELPYEYSALEPHYSGRSLEHHHEKCHAGIVRGANTALEKLSEARAGGNLAAIDQLQRSLTVHLSGHVLHTVLWKNLSPRGGGEPEGELAAAVQEFFGSYTNLRQKLTAAAMDVQGSGWGSLGWDPLGKKLAVEQVYDHHGNIGNDTVPLLVLDMWEHAYYLQHENVRENWVKSFWNLVDWSDVAKRFSSVRTIALAI